MFPKCQCQETILHPMLYVRLGIALFLEMLSLIWLLEKELMSDSNF